MLLCPVFFMMELLVVTNRLMHTNWPNQFNPPQIAIFQYDRNPMVVCTKTTDNHVRTTTINTLYRHDTVFRSECLIHELRI